MIKYISRLSVVLAAVFLSSCSDKNDTDTDASQVLVMGTSADMPPFEFYESVNGEAKITGFDIEVAQMIAGKLNKRLHIKDMDFSGLIPALKSGRIQIAMASMTPTPDRRKAVSFTRPYLSLPVAVIMRPSMSITSEADLSGKKIGVQLGSSHEQFAKDLAETQTTMNVIPMNKLGDMVQDLRSKRLDVAIMETKTARAFQQQYPELKVHVLEGHDVGFAVALAKESPIQTQIDQAILELLSSGEIEKLREKWFKS